MSEVLGVIVLARNGDRLEYYQDPETYRGAFTQTTPLGEVQSHKLGAFLRSVYLNPDSPDAIASIDTDLVNNHQVHVRVKAGGEGTVVFDSAIALLQGLFPPNPKNKIELANDTIIIAPLGGYQYVPVETVEPGNDRSLESWTDCPAFAKHIEKVHSSEEFKAKARDAEPFFRGVRDFIFGRQPKLENIWNIYDFISSELVHNKTYAYRLPPSYDEQAQALANYHENAIFSDANMSGIGNIAGRTLLHTILSSLERIAFDADPLQFLLIESTYQPFISLFHQTEITKEHPEFAGIPNYASAFAIELRRGAPPDTRDFLRFKFMNGSSAPFQAVHAFGHEGDIPLTEFIYRIEHAAITSNAQWAQVCNGGTAKVKFPGLGFTDAVSNDDAAKGVRESAYAGVLALVLFLGLFMLSRFVGRRSRARRVRLEGEELFTGVQVDEKTRLV